MNHNVTMKCLFCGTDNIIQMYQVECKACRMDYMAVQNVTRDSWDYIGQCYKFSDPEHRFHALNMDLRTKQSTIWVFKEPYNGFDMYSITLPLIYPSVKPEDALALTRRLYNLIAFS